MKKIAICLLLIFIGFAAIGCTGPTTPEVEDPLYPDPIRVMVGRQWFYGRVNDLAYMGEKTFVQRTDWLAELLAEVDVVIEEK